MVGTTKGDEHEGEVALQRNAWARLDVFAQVPAPPTST